MYQDPFVDKMPTTQAGMGEQCRAICNENSILVENMESFIISMMMRYISNKRMQYLHTLRMIYVASTIIYDASYTCT